MLPQFIDEDPRVLAVVYRDRDQLHATLLKSPLERANATKPGFPNLMPKSAKPSVACFQRSGRIEARIGLRMMPTFPRSPLSFRTVSFPQYGWKTGFPSGKALRTYG
jgi:hypothetical protein